MKSKLIDVLEEQILVQFTGKINILASFNRQFLGHVLFKNGEVIQVRFEGLSGVKAFYQLLIKEYSLQSFMYVVEPELIEDNEREIHFPFSVLKNRMKDVLKLYRDSLKLRPPENIKIIINPSILKSSDSLSYEEFQVLDTLTEWNNPYEIYKKCPLLDHEITLSLVSLRKKGGLKILGTSP